MGLHIKRPDKVESSSDIYLFGKHWVHSCHSLMVQHE